MYTRKITACDECPMADEVNARLENGEPLSTWHCELFGEQFEMPAGSKPVKCTYGRFAMLDHGENLRMFYP